MTLSLASSTSAIDMAIIIFDMKDITPILPGTLWKYKEDIYLIMSSEVNADKTWEVTMVNRSSDIVCMTVTCEEWLNEAKYIREVDEE